jgi:D-glycero-alpha-D-manno-heptose 1-phosphate guanylyltransferase
MEAIILAGGLGTRLREVVPDLPKPMAMVAGKPFLEIMLTKMAAQGFDRIILSLGYMAEKITTYFGNNFQGMELIYEIEDAPLGTGGAIKAALQHCKTEYAIIFNGDTYLELAISELVKVWSINKSPVIVVREVPDTVRFGRIHIENGQIINFLEKGIQGPGYINAGCYVLPKHTLDRFAINKPFSIETEYFMKELSSQTFNAYITKGLFIDIGVPEDYELAQNLLANS